MIKTKVAFLEGRLLSSQSGPAFYQGFFPANLKVIKKLSKLKKEKRLDGKKLR